MAEEKNKVNSARVQGKQKADKHEQLKGKEQETETQNTQDANYNPTVMDNNNKESIASPCRIVN